jgi:hypothetical protein
MPVVVIREKSPRPLDHHIGVIAADGPLGSTREHDSAEAGTAADVEETLRLRNDGKEHMQFVKTKAVVANRYLRRTSDVGRLGVPELPDVLISSIALFALPRHSSPRRGLFFS